MKSLTKAQVLARMRAGDLPTRAGGFTNTSVFGDGARAPSAVMTKLQRERKIDYPQGTSISCTWTLVEAVKAQTSEAWTKPYYGVQHLGEFSLQKPWVTVCDYSTFALLHCHFPGCGFSPVEKRFKSAQDARIAGERYLRTGVLEPNGFIELSQIQSHIEGMRGELLGKKMTGQQQKLFQALGRAANELAKAYK